jgi:hypothetical protein
MNWMTRPPPSLHASPLPRCDAVFARNSLTLMRSPTPLRQIESLRQLATGHRLPKPSASLPLTMGGRLRGVFAKCFSVLK